MQLLIVLIISLCCFSLYYFFVQKSVRQPDVKTDDMFLKEYELRHLSMSNAYYLNQQSEYRIKSLLKKTGHFKYRESALDDFGRPLNGSLLIFDNKALTQLRSEMGRFKKRKMNRINTSIPTPSGWQTRYYKDDVWGVDDVLKPYLEDSRIHVLERGHLIPFWLIGHYDSVRNIVPLTAFTNKGFQADSESAQNDKAYLSHADYDSMLYVENKLRYLLKGHGFVLNNGEQFVIHVKPTYIGHNIVPTRIQYQICILNSKGKYVHFEFLKRQYLVLNISVPVQMKDGSIVVLKALS